MRNDADSIDLLQWPEYTQWTHVQSRLGSLDSKLSVVASDWFRSLYAVIVGFTCLVVVVRQRVCVCVCVCSYIGWWCEFSVVNTLSFCIARTTAQLQNVPRCKLYASLWLSIYTILFTHVSLCDSSQWHLCLVLFVYVEHQSYVKFSCFFLNDPCSIVGPGLVSSLKAQAAEWAPYAIPK